MPCGHQSYHHIYHIMVIKVVIILLTGSWSSMLWSYWLDHRHLSYDHIYWIVVIKVIIIFIYKIIVIKVVIILTRCWSSMLWSYWLDYHQLVIIVALWFIIIHIIHVLTMNHHHHHHHDNIIRTMLIQQYVGRFQVPVHYMPPAQQEMFYHHDSWVMIIHQDHL